MATTPATASASTVQTATTATRASTASATSAQQGTGKAGETTQSAFASARSQQNASILRASLEVSIQAGDDSLALLYRSAIEHINETLSSGRGVDVIGEAAANQDNTPDATAGRILSFATGFFDAYAAQHPDKDAETLARDFVDVVRGGFEKGFAEAKHILDGLGVLGGSDVETGIMKTYELVMKGFDDFLAAKLTPPAASAEGGGEAANAGGEGKTAEPAPSRTAG